MSAKQNKIRLFIKAMIFAVVGLLMIELGQIISLKSVQHSAKQSEPDSLSTRNADEYFFTESFKDFPEELQLVNTEGKQGLFIFFEMQGCPYCKFMEDNVLNLVHVQNFYNSHFRNIIIDIHTASEAIDVDGTEMTEKSLAAKYGVNLTPTMLFLGSDGHELYRKQGFIKSADEFLAMGEEIVELISVDQ